VYAVLADIIAWPGAAVRGYGNRMDDAALARTAAGVQNHMDGRQRGDWVVTQRHGRKKPVEFKRYGTNALRTMEGPGSSARKETSLLALQTKWGSGANKALAKGYGTNPQESL